MQKNLKSDEDNSPGIFRVLWFLLMGCLEGIITGILQVILCPFIVVLYLYRMVTRTSTYTMSDVAVEHFGAVEKHTEVDKCGKIIFSFVTAYSAKLKKLSKAEENELHIFECYLMSCLSVGFANYFDIDYKKIVRAWSSLYQNKFARDKKEESKELLLTALALGEDLAKKHFLEEKEFSKQFLKLTIVVCDKLTPEKRREVTANIYDEFDKLWNLFKKDNHSAEQIL